MTVTVVNIKKSDYDIFIGRPSKWGNPFIIGIHGTRKEVIEKYRQWITSQPDLLNNLNELKNKRLGCYCKPSQCHGDILVKLVNDLNKKDIF